MACKISHILVETGCFKTLLNLTLFYKSIVLTVVPSRVIIIRDNRARPSVVVKIAIGLLNQ